MSCVNLLNILLLNIDLPLNAKRGRYLSMWCSLNSKLRCETSIEINNSLFMYLIKIRWQNSIEKTIIKKRAIIMI